MAQSTDITRIYQQVQDILIQKAIFPANSVYVGINEDDLMCYQPGDQYCVICPRRQVADRAMQIGGDRLAGDADNGLGYFMDIEGTMDIFVVCRLSFDKSPQQTEWFTNDTYGVLAKMSQVVNALELQQGYQEGGDRLWIIPPQLNEFEFYKRECKGIGWGIAKLSYRYDFSWNFGLQV